MTFAVPAFPFGCLAAASALFKEYQGLLQFLSHELGIQLRKEHSGNWLMLSSCGCIYYYANLGESYKCPVSVWSLKIKAKRNKPGKASAGILRFFSLSCSVISQLDISVSTQQVRYHQSNHYKKNVPNPPVWGARIQEAKWSSCSWGTLDFSLSFLFLFFFLPLGGTLEAFGGIQFSSVQFSRSVVSHSLRLHESQHTRPPCPSPTPEFTQTHAHRVGDAIQPSHPLSSSYPPDPNPSQPQGLFQWVNSSNEVAKVLEFQLQHQSFQWTPRADLLYDGLVGSPCSPRDSQEELGMCFDVSVWKSLRGKPQTMHWWGWAKVGWWARVLGSFTQKTLRCIWGGHRDPGSSDVPLLGSCREEAKTVHL